MNKSLITVVCFLFFCFYNGKAQVVGDSSHADSLNLDSTGYHRSEIDDGYLQTIENLMVEVEKQEKAKEVIRQYEDGLLKKEMKFNWLSTIPVARGVLLTSTTNNFKRRKVLYERHSDKNWPDYGPAVLPLAVTWGLKAAGVESRSKTKRMFTANLIGLGISTGLTNLLKHSITERRPDGTDKHSMPSGHSSLAYFCATVLDREFGHHSPWISIAGYTAATATQLQRIHRNRHYINDVVTGAGIGVMSANLGYFITDKIYGEKEINKPKLSVMDINNFRKFLVQPTSFALVSGVTTGRNSISADNYELLKDGIDCNLRTTAGFTTGLQYECFLNENWAVTANTRLAQYKVQVLQDNVPFSENEILGDNFYSYHINAGVEYSMPIEGVVRVNVKTFAGDRYIPKADFRNMADEVALRIKNSNSFEIGGAVEINMFSSSKYIASIECGYTHAWAKMLRNRWTLSSSWKVLL